MIHLLFILVSLKFTCLPSEKYFMQRFPYTSNSNCRNINYIWSIRIYKQYINQNKYILRGNQLRLFIVYTFPLVSNIRNCLSVKLLILMQQCKIIPFDINGGCHEILTDELDSTLTVKLCIVPGSMIHHIKEYDVISYKYITSMYSYSMYIHTSINLTCLFSCIVDIV